MGKRSVLQLKRQQQKRNMIIAFLVGTGLIVLALAILIYLPGTLSDAANISTTPIVVNYPAPQLSLENIQGKTESLADFRDKVLLVNNWATWCPPCKAEMPTLVAFYNEHAKNGLMIVAIEAGEPKDLVQQYANQFKMPFSVWLDPGGKSLDAFKNQNLPNSYVIDRTGTVRLMWTGEINRSALEKYVTPLLSSN
jgi:thiol-disulfide isomerase/thioredoxin